MDVFKQNILSYFNENARGNLYRHLVHVNSFCLQIYLCKPIDFQYKKFITVISTCVAPSPDFFFLRRPNLLLVLAYHVLSTTAGFPISLAISCQIRSFKAVSLYDLVFVVYNGICLEPFHHTFLNFRCQIR